MRLAACRKFQGRIKFSLSSLPGSSERGGGHIQSISSSRPSASPAKPTDNIAAGMAGESGKSGKMMKHGATAVEGLGVAGSDSAWLDPIPSPSDSATSATAAAFPQIPPALASGYPNRVAGCLLGKMCGDVLGAAVEGWAAEDIQLSNPDGLTDFLQTERGFGCYTDDTQMAIALARSLVACGGRVDDVHVARSYAEEYQQSRGYGGTAYKILSGIKSGGIDSDSIRTIGTKYIAGGSFGNGGAMRIAPLGLVYRHAPPAVLREAVAAALRCTHVHPVAIDGAFVIALAVGYLATRQPGPPLPLAAPPAGVDAAGAPGAAGAAATPTAAAAEPTTTTTTATSVQGQMQMPRKVPTSVQVQQTLEGGSRGGLDAPPERSGGSAGVGGAPSSSTAAATAAGKVEVEAATAAGAAAEVEAEVEVATPVGLLDYLLDHCGSRQRLLETEGEMELKLRTVREALLQAARFKGPDEPWSHYLISPEWEAERRLQSQVAEQFQIRADDAAAAATAALCFHWGRPEDALVAAVHYGGDTDTVAAITGALAGSLYGTQWLPARWYGKLENGPAGRDVVLGLAEELAQLDTRD
ncbi:hypothetical protein PLESTB_001212700 [Pleodorina starrii]|uniref:ADP-ribosylhydrolase ARH3 n=1 Tax=Pleodorina starrii TaxID=330485 RepID=A0A9W6F6A9_9CHLO|nr:hypothetical protein PLESTB_001212700 [Pleodorina starrii]GLC71268.1 hypothetical protein PLESTF_001097100 [Pleodorina starrii]